MKAETQGIHVLRNQKGMALLVTIMTVALLVALTIQYHQTTWNKYLVSHNYMVGVQLSAIADSGINIAIAILQNDAKENEIDSYFDSWAELMNEQFAELFPTGTLQVRIDDLAGRLPINTLVSEVDGGQQGVDATLATESRNILFSLLLSGVFPVKDEAEAMSIVDAIVDWIDADDKESNYGAETLYYQSLENPYACKNQPLQYIEELLLIRGITPELLFGKSDEAAGLADYLTVYTSDGKINLNTAAPLLIKSFNPLISDELVELLINYRTNKENEENLVQPDWYGNITGWPEDIVINESILTTKSTFFQVTATGAVDTLSRRIVADIERVDTDKIHLLGKKME